MAHNEIEYGIMQSYTEGLEIPEKSPFNLDLKSVANGWRFSSVIRSWLLDLIVNALEDDPKLEKLKDYVPETAVREDGRFRQLLNLVSLSMLLLHLYIIDFNRSRKNRLQ